MSELGEANDVIFSKPESSQPLCPIFPLQLPAERRSIPILLESHNYSSPTT